ncbi:sensor histidine kinase [Bradyrhizobium tropiciagri]|uniref:sensor histidine kinase n=1 Tax=Bradyrhizobium tropiciagri TaxID=312253 RepID=UPI000A92B55D|nr:MASE4 domain-containing protein [Bradyrhizobium tropiciagri]
METSLLDLEGHEFVLSNLPPSPTHKRLALGIVFALLVVFVVSAPFATLPIRRIDAFVPAYATAIFVNDLITAALLFAHFAIVPSGALLALASGYLLTALIVIPWALTFPGVFSPGGLLGAGLQSTAWLNAIWHVGFPLFVIAYSLLKEADSVQRFSRVIRPAILASVGLVAAFVGSATALVTVGGRIMPALMFNEERTANFAYYLNVPIMALVALALVLLWVRVRSVLDLWLMVVMCAYATEAALQLFPVPTRFSVGWYAGRVCGLLSGSLVLLILLQQITMLYGQLLHAVLGQRREREARLMTGDAISASIAHEVKQPLGAIVTNASAGLNLLKSAEPDIDMAEEAFRDIVSDGHRAAAVIDNIRTLYRKGTQTWTSLDVNNVVRQALALVDDSLRTHRVDVRADFSAQLPLVRGEQVQLQQVLVNLITNAIDSMATSDGERVLSIRSELHHSGYVMVSVEDTGKGLDPGAADRIFNPLFTTKTHGMGMGLAICRSIVEAHEGELWVTAKPVGGATFHFTVPVEAAGASDRALPLRV